MEHQLANEIIDYVRSDEGCRLKYEKLGCLLELIIYNEKVVNILKQTPINNRDVAICFNHQYDNFIHKNQNFALMSDINSFALSWLHCLYH